MVTLHSFVAKDALLEIVDQQNEQKTVFRSDAQGARICPKVDHL